MSTPSPALTIAYLTTLWTFQLIAAGPIFIWLGLAAIFNLFYTFDRAYDFITHLCTSLSAAAIFFIVLVQRKVRAHSGLTRLMALRFEVAKSAFATALWVWLMLDAVFGPEDHYGWRETRRTRIIAAGVSVILLFILFYPTIFFVLGNQDLLESEHHSEDVAEDEEERQPLLQGS